MTHVICERQWLRAIAHPLRLMMLSSMTHSGRSAAQLARQFGISQAAASYHVRTLADAGLVVAGDIRNVRGGVEKLYLVAHFGPLRSEDGPPSSAVAEAVDALQQLLILQRDATHLTNSGVR